MNNAWGRQDQKGQVLLLVFLLMILLGMIIGSAALMWELGLQSSGLESDSVKAFYIAEAALSRAIDDIAYHDGATGDVSSTPFAGGSYTIVINSVGNPKITATGWYGKSQRQVYSVQRSSGAACATPSDCPPYGNAWGHSKKGQNDWTEQ